MELVFKAKSWWKGEWELWYGEQVMASLTIKNWSYSLTEVTIANTKWKMGYSGWLGNHFFVRDETGNNVSEATSRKWFSYDADITIENKKYRLGSNGWQSRFYALDEGGAEIVSLKPQWWKGGAEVSTTRPPQDKTTLLLANILFYQYQLAETNSAGASSSGAIATVS